MEDHDESRWMMGAVAVTIGVLAFLFYQEPEVFVSLLLLLSAGGLVVGLVVLLTLNKAPLFDLATDLWEQYPDGEMILNGQGINELQDFAYLNLNSHAIAVDICDDGPYITFRVRDYYGTYWKTTRGGYTRVVQE